MYTIFFTINCVEQLTFYKTFVDQLQFKQLIFFWSKSETARNTRTADDFWFSTNFHFFCQLLDLRWAVDIFVSTSFFKLSNFEQLIFSLFFPWKTGIWDIKNIFFFLLKTNFRFFKLNAAINWFRWVMIICSKFVCSKNLLNTIFHLLHTIRANVTFFVNSKIICRTCI